MANPFYVNPMADRSQALGGLAESIRAFGQARDEKAEKQRELEIRQKAEQKFNTLKTDLQSAWDADDPDAIAELAIQNPEYSEMIDRVLGMQSDKQKRSPARKITSNMYLNAWMDPENALKHLGQGMADLYQQTGKVPQEMISDIGNARLNPQGFSKKAQMMFSMLEPEAFKAMQKATTDKTGVYNPRDYTTESWAEYLDTGDPRVLQRYAPAKSVEIGGVPHMFDPAKGGYFPAVVSGSSQTPAQPGQPATTPTGGREITTRSVAESKAEIAGAVTTAQKEAEARVNEVLKQQGQMGKVDQAESVYDFLMPKDATGKTDMSVLESIYGKGESLYPELLRSQRGIDAMAQRDQLISMLQLGARGELKGQGPITENEQKILSKAATALDNPDISPTLAARYIDDAMEVLRRNAGVDIEAELTSEDSEAVKWARANRNNPKWAEKANEILRLNNQNR